jgi:hypothetical protein
MIKRKEVVLLKLGFDSSSSDDDVNIIDSSDSDTNKRSGKR